MRRLIDQALFGRATKDLTLEPGQLLFDSLMLLLKLVISCSQLSILLLGYRRVFSGFRHGLYYTAVSRQKHVDSA